MTRTALFTVLLAVSLPVFVRLSAAPVAATRSIKRGDGDSVLAKAPETRQLLLDIITVTGLQPNFELKEASVLNIEAAISHRKRYILYNPSFINSLYTVTKDKWAATALLAHEVGHHLNGHTIRKGGSSPRLELEADEFAGFILYKLGASLEQAQSVMNYIAKPGRSKTHPGKNSRMEAIRKGWDKAAAAVNNTVVTARAK